MNARLLPTLRGFDRTQVANQIAQLESNKANDPLTTTHMWRREIRIGDFTAAAALSQELDLHDDLTAAALQRRGQSGLFPGLDADGHTSPVDVEGCYIRTITDFSGGGAAVATVEAGDTGVDNGLLTITNVFTGVGAGLFISTPAATEYAIHPETAFIPTLTLTSDVNIDTLTAGALELCIRYRTIVRDT